MRFFRQSESESEGKVAELLAAARRPSEELAGVALAQRDATLATLQWLLGELNRMNGVGSPRVSRKAVRDMTYVAGLRIREIEYGQLGRYEKKVITFPEGTTQPEVMDWRQFTQSQSDEIARLIADNLALRHQIKHRDNPSPTSVVPPVVE